MHQRCLWDQIGHAGNGSHQILMGVSIILLAVSESADRHHYHRYYGTIFTSILNVATWQGFLIVNVIIGGQTLAAASSHLDASLGIVIIGLISLAVREPIRYIYYRLTSTHR